MKSAIYAGSFDPITNGHIDIVHRAKNLFDRIYISVVQNPDKNSLFSLSERMAIIQELFKDEDKIRVEGFEGLLVNFAKKKNTFTIVRGLRAVSDFDFEFQMALTNRSLDHNIDTVFLMTDERYSYLSSSLVKQIAKLNGNIDAFVPALVAKKLREKNNHE